METMHHLSDLHVHSTNWRVYVKILALYNHNPTLNGDETTMLLVDEKSSRIDAKIPEGSYLYKFRDVLRIGVWYYMSDFQVVLSQSEVKYALRPIHIKCLFHTQMWPVPSRSSRRFFDFVAPDEVKYATDDQFNCVTDAIGVIVKVYPIRSFPFVCRQGETDYESRYVAFKIKDNMGNAIKCVAIGKYCEEFVNKWFTRTSLITFNYEPIVAVLNFWRITNYHGSNVLMTVDGISRLFIDPKFNDINIPSYIRGFSDLNEADNDLMMEVVDEN